MGPAIDLETAETVETVGGGSTTMTWTPESPKKGTLAVVIGPSNICGTPSGGVTFTLKINGCGILKVTGTGKTSKAGVNPSANVSLLGNAGLGTSLKLLFALSKPFTACPEAGCSTWCSLNEDAVAGPSPLTSPAYVDVTCGQDLRILITAASGQPGNSFPFDFDIEAVASKPAP